MCVAVGNGVDVDLSVGMRVDVMPAVGDLLPGTEVLLLAVLQLVKRKIRQKRKGGRIQLTREEAL